MNRDAKIARIVATNPDDELFADEMLHGQGIKPGGRRWAGVFPTWLYTAAMIEHIEPTIEDPNEDDATSLVEALFITRSQENDTMGRITHTKAAAAGAGPLANTGLARFTEVHNDLFLSGVSLAWYRVLTKCQDAVLRMLSIATGRKKEMETLAKKLEAAREKVREAFATHRDEGSAASSEALEDAQEEAASLRTQHDTAVASHRKVTDIIRGTNGWLMRFDSEVRKNRVTKTANGEELPAESHKQRKERTKRFLLAATDLMPETELTVPPLDVLALCTGRTVEALKPLFIGRDGKTQYEAPPIPVEELVKMGSEQQEQQKSA